jgi:hypothetical protein
VKDAIVVRRAVETTARTGRSHVMGKFCTDWPASSSAANDFSGHTISHIGGNAPDYTTPYCCVHVAFVVREVHWSRIVGICSGTLLSGRKMLSGGLGIV